MVELNVEKLGIKLKDGRLGMTADEMNCSTTNINENDENMVYARIGLYITIIYMSIICILYNT